MNVVIGASPTWGHVVRQDAIPLLSGYLVFVGAEVAYARSRATSAMRPPAANPFPHSRGRGWRDFARYLALIVASGYLVFLAIVVMFYFALGNQPRSFIADALAGGSLLTFVIVVPAFVLLTLLNETLLRRRRRASRSPDGSSGVAGKPGA